ncbi:MAG TPA: Wzz/FepE/Etk N-terminal domain-containing protein, partial [Ornithinibacter sp.]|nr:Wzz/FepE/Etk N-terminal domain-containing protein [Ornithinibacter sp.]
MSEQAVDLRSTWAVLRRRSRLLAVAALLGSAAGVALLLVAPPAFTSTSVVLLPSAAQSGSGRAGGYDAETQVLITKSSDVLDPAVQASQTELTSDEVRDRLTVEVPAPSVLRITATGATAGQAEDLAHAVAESLLAYLQESNSTLSEGRRAQLQ